MTSISDGCSLRTIILIYFVRPYYHILCFRSFKVHLNNFFTTSPLQYTRQSIYIIAWEAIHCNYEIPPFSLSLSLCHYIFFSSYRHQSMYTPPPPPLPVSYQYQCLSFRILDLLPINIRTLLKGGLYMIQLEHDIFPLMLLPSLDLDMCAWHCSLFYSIFHWPLLTSCCLCVHV